MPLARVTARSLGALGVLVASLAASYPTAALACPACLGADAKNAAFLKLGSLFVLLPFVIVGLVYRVLRQAPERDAGAPRVPLSRG